MSELTHSARHLPLTAARIKAARPGMRDTWLSDDHGVRGLGRLLLRITPQGVRRFYYRVLHGGVRRTIPLGPYSRTCKPGHLTIQQARAAASSFIPVGAASAPITLRPPLVAPQEHKAPSAAKPTVLTLLELCRLYVESLERAKKVSARDVSNMVRRHIQGSNLAHLPAHVVTSVQCTELLRVIVDAGKGRTAKKVRSILHAAYRMALGAGLNPGESARLVDNRIVSNPIASIDNLDRFNRARDRALKKHELARFWERLNPADDSSVTICMRVVRLTMLLGGQRCEQLLRVRVTDVDVDARTILLFDGKGRRARPREHLLPLVETAMRDVNLLIAFSQSVSSTLLFQGSRAGVAVSPESISKVVRSISARLVEQKLIDAPFGYTDIRRTIETLFPTIGVTQDVSAQIQSHGLGGIQMRHYNRHKYMEEKLDALRKWEAFLASLLESGTTRLPAP